MPNNRPSTHRTPSTAPDLSILGDSVTLQPGLESPLLPSTSPPRTTTYGATPAAAGTETADPSSTDAPERNLVEHMARFRDSPFEFLREVSLYVSGSGWRSYDHIVGQPVFYEGFSEEMKNAVMRSQMLKEKIRGLAGGRVDLEAGKGLFGGASGGVETVVSGHGDGYEKKRVKRRRELEESLTQVAEQMVDNMICKMESKMFIRGACYLATQLLTRAYHLGIHVSSVEILRLRAVAEQAAKQKRAIIFLPNHRSHVDYVSLQLICFRLGLTLPTVVAGDNLNFPLLGSFLQHAGAMWIRRSFGDDELYQTVVQAYIDTLLQRGYNFECFIEGGRSRIGKLLPPKFGILSFILDSILSNRVEDAIICPVSTQYDKVIEVDSYISELLGTPKPKENLLDFLSASSVLSLRLGRVDVRFHEPWSLRQFVDTQQSRFESLSMEQQRKLQNAYDRDVRVRLLQTLGYKILADINAVSVVMPTSLIGTVLLTLRGKGVGKEELVRRVEWLSERVRAQGGRVAHFAGLPTRVVVERGLEVLGPKLVGVERGLLEEMFFAVDRFQLSFYRNMTIHLFISQALVCAALYLRLKPGGPSATQSTPYPELLHRVQFLSQLFRGEFIFSPTQGLVANLDETIAGLERDGVVCVKRKTNTAGASGDGELQEIEAVELSDEERASGRENFDFYCFLIWPFIESSWLGAVSLLMLTPPPPTIPSPTVPAASPPPRKEHWLPTQTLQSSAQLLGKTLHASGDVAYLEAVNKETLKNAFTRFEEEGIIVVRKPKRGSGDVEVVRLAEEWMPWWYEVEGGKYELRPEGKLWDFCEEISRSRLEGKNRRDGDAANRRVLGLIEKLAAVATGAGSGDATGDAAAAGSRRDGLVKGGETGVDVGGVGEGQTALEAKEEKSKKKRLRGRMRASL